MNHFLVEELLPSLTQSYNFQDPKHFLENIPSPKQEDIVFPSNLQIDQKFAFEHKTKTKYLESRFNLENTTDEIFFAQSFNLGLQGNVINHAFTNPITNYMEVLFSSRI